MDPNGRYFREHYCVMGKAVQTSNVHTSGDLVVPLAASGR